jgi:hypothetical protein
MGIKKKDLGFRGPGPGARHQALGSKIVEVKKAVQSLNYLLVVSAETGLSEAHLLFSFGSSGGE